MLISAPIAKRPCLAVTCRSTRHAISRRWCDGSRRCSCSLPSWMKSTEWRETATPGEGGAGPVVEGRLRVVVRIGGRSRPRFVLRADDGGAIPTPPRACATGTHVALSMRSGRPASYGRIFEELRRAAGGSLHPSGVASRRKPFGRTSARGNRYEGAAQRTRNITRIWNVPAGKRTSR